MNEKNVKDEAMCELLSTDPDRIKIIDILNKLILNLIKEPNNETFRKLKKSNKIISNYILSKHILVEFLNWLGFLELDIEGEDCFVIFEIDIPKLSKAVEDLRKFRTGFPIFEKTNESQKNPEEQKEMIEKNQKNTHQISLKTNQPVQNIQKNESSVAKKITPVNNPVDLLKQTADFRKKLIPELHVNTQTRDLSSLRMRNMTNQSIIPDYYIHNTTGKSSDIGKLDTPSEGVGKMALQLTNKFRVLNGLGPLKYYELK
jgi:hypothetical protein